MTTAPTHQTPLPPIRSLRHFDDTRSVFEPYGFTCELWEARPTSRPDRHEEIEINFLDRGTLFYMLGGQRVTVHPRTFTMFWGAIPHQIIGEEDVSFYYVVTIPFANFLQIGLPRQLLSRLIRGDVIQESSSDRQPEDPMIFNRWHRDLEKSTDDMRQIVQMELAARIWRLSLNLAETPNEPDPGENHSRMTKAELMANYIASHYRTKIQNSQIAEVVDLHPNYASALFKQTFGTTFSALILKHRLAEAQRLLLTSDDTIVQIAQEAGFESLSRFNRAFKESIGMTPRDYRKRRSWLTGRDNSSRNSEPLR
ncbi:helix-turn-helix domain-containing protein [Planctomicrobium sp. SH664]|uniref:helix-turn-helix domain-containing protein n=1 Tax=Planctomicrobium sp. SH664 TaxID=3448125 RepID=UPI003F5B3371